MRVLCGVWLVVVACGAPARSTTPASQSWNPSAYRAAIADALAARFAADPTAATLHGEHRYDDQWPDLTAAARERVLEDFHRRATQLRELATASPTTVTGAQQDAAGTDHPALDARLLADFLDGWREYALAVRPTEKHPSLVLSVISSGIDRILAHNYAPLATRMASVASRLEKVPALIATARAQLDHPRHAAVEMTPITARALIAMLKSPTLHPDPKQLGGHSALAARVAAAADAAATAVEEYRADIVRTFPVDQAAEQPIGVDAWARIARFHEGVTMPPAQIKQLAQAELVRLQGELDKLVATAGKPGETRDAFLTRMAEEQPAPEAVLDEYRASEQRLEAWLRRAAFITVPWDKLHLEITISPPHARANSLASLNMSGELDATTDARFEVNVPTPDLPEPMQKALRAFHARGALDLVSAHEGLPGHYLQMLTLREQPSMVRKTMWSFNFTEGWAHYCEEAILDAGFSGDPLPARARAYMLRLALQRAVRVIVDIGEADGSLTLDSAAKRFETDGMLQPEAARMEARRGMVSPVNMFAYMYGKLAIKKLRDTVRAREGARFSLQSFHDRLLSLGGVPVADVGEVVFGVPRE